MNTDPSDIVRFITNLRDRFSGCLADPRWSQSIQTKAIISGIRIEASECGARIATEVGTEAVRGGCPERGGEYNAFGRIDVLVTFQSGMRLAIEIDRGNKRWSMEKLVFCVNNYDCAALWIRWRGFVTSDRPENILVLDLCGRTARFLGSTPGVNFDRVVTAR